mgnify:CR=1 FL=1
MNGFEPSVGVFNHVTLVREPEKVVDHRFAGRIGRGHGGGQGGQPFLDMALPKIAEAREMVRRYGGDIWVQVDGGVVFSCAQAGQSS